jgi:tetratricopeptide (TPR) repeat protein
MKTTRLGLALLMIAVLTASPGCGAKRKQVTDRDRKEAAILVSEAQFALTLRDWGRAEGLLIKAVEVAPEGDFWLTLGSARVRLGNRSGAREAYQAALKAYENDAALNGTTAEPWLKQVYVLAVMGRTDDSRALLAKAAKRFPNDTKVRSLLDPKQFELMVSGPNFKDMAL